MPEKKRLCDLALSGKTVLMRVDFNVPMQEGRITDERRIEAALPSIREVLSQGGKVIVMSHLGRPKGAYDPQYSMAPVARALSQALGQEVVFVPDPLVVSEKVRHAAQALSIGQVMLLDNLRFAPGETKNDPEFAQMLSSLGDVYVNDAFGTAHRAHASTAGIASYLPSAMGLLIQREVEVMGSLLTNPKHPFVAVLGGSKVSDKIGVIENLLGKVDALLIGGAMAYTFLAAQGVQTGASRVELDKKELALSLLEKARAKHVRLLLPMDHIIAPTCAPGQAISATVDQAIPKDQMALDIGPKTLKAYTQEIQEAATVLWNGPMGVFEIEEFAAGTSGVAKAIQASSAISVIGGGDSAFAVDKLGFAPYMTHISTGGGAALEFLEGKILPGIDVLSERQE